MKVTKLDTLVSAIERRWGVDRLPRLVSPATRALFETAQAMERGERHPPPGTDIQALMARAWGALEDEAITQGHQHMPPACFEVATDDPRRGTVVICESAEHMQTILLRAKQEGRQVEGWTLAEVALHLNGKSTLLRIVAEAKDAFPGATLRRSTRAVPKDDLPFGDLADVGVEA